MARKYKKRFYRRNVSKKIKRYVQNAIRYNVEDKYQQFALGTNFSSVGLTFVEQNVSNVARGTQAFERIGSEIKIKSIYFRGILQGAQTGSVADDSNSSIRLILGLYNTAYGGLTPMATSGFNGLNLGTWINKKNCTQMQWKFMDKLIFLPAQATASTGYLPTGRVVKFYKKFKRPIRIRYFDDNPGTAANSLIFSMASDSGAVVHPGFTYGSIVIRYEDA